MNVGRNIRTISYFKGRLIATINNQENFRTLIYINRGVLLVLNKSELTEKNKQAMICSVC